MTRVRSFVYAATVRVDNALADALWMLQERVLWRAFPTLRRRMYYVVIDGRPVTLLGHQRVCDVSAVQRALQDKGAPDGLAICTYSLEDGFQAVSA